MPDMVSPLSLMRRYSSFPEHWGAVRVARGELVTLPDELAKGLLRQRARRRLADRRLRSDFPKPLAELACGPVCDLDQIENYKIARSGGRIGRGDACARARASAPRCVSGARRLVRVR
jgi:hypothetical protein